MKIKALILLILVTTFFSVKPFALEQNVKKNTSFDTIKTDIKNFLYKKLNNKFSGIVEIDVKNIDESIQFKTCQNKLTFSLANHDEIGQRTLVKVCCNDPHPWKLLVPANIQVIENVVITNKPLPKGKVITSSDLSMQNVNILKLYNGYYSNPQSIAGKILKSSARAGTIITSQLIANPKIISRGEIINISYKSKLFDIKAKGKALNDGAINEIISVQNLRSKKIIDGKITAKGEISID